MSAWHLVHKHHQQHPCTPTYTHTHIPRYTHLSSLHCGQAATFPHRHTPISLADRQQHSQIDTTFSLLDSPTFPHRHTPISLSEIHQHSQRRPFSIGFCTAVYRSERRHWGLNQKPSGWDSNVRATNDHRHLPAS